MAGYRRHVFVCLNERDPGHPRGCCNPDGSNALKECFKAELKKLNLGPTVRANEAGCLDQCELGSTVVIYPQQIWYGHVTPADMPRIVEETVVHGRVLDDLLIPADWVNTKGRGPKA